MVPIYYMHMPIRRSVKYVKGAVFRMRLICLHFDSIVIVINPNHNPLHS